MKKILFFTFIVMLLFIFPTNPIIQVITIPTIILIFTQTVKKKLKENIYNEKIEYVKDFKNENKRENKNEQEINYLKELRKEFIKINTNEKQKIYKKK